MEMLGKQLTKVTTPRRDVDAFLNKRQNENGKYEMKETLFEGYVIATLLRTEQLKLKLLMVSVRNAHCALLKA